MEGRTLGEIFFPLPAGGVFFFLVLARFVVAGAVLAFIVALEAGFAVITGVDFSAHTIHSER